jgi:hypothetical protein
MSDEEKTLSVNIEKCDCGWCNIEEWIDNNNNTNIDINLLTQNDINVRYLKGDEEKYIEITNDIIKEFWYLYNELNHKKMLKQNKHYHTHRGNLNIDLHIIPSFMRGYKKFHLIISKD